MLDDVGPGHNSAETTKDVGGIAADRLRSLIERIERLNTERAALVSDVSDVYKEAKSAGFETKIIRQLVRIRAQDPDEAKNEEMLLDAYRVALGMT